MGYLEKLFGSLVVELESIRLTGRHHPEEFAQRLGDRALAEGLGQPLVRVDPDVALRGNETFIVVIRLSGAKLKPCKGP